jgi:hypothetical protein
MIAPSMRRNAPWNPRFARAQRGFAPLARAAAFFEHFADFPPVAAWNDALTPCSLTNASGRALRFVVDRAPARRRRDTPIDLASLYDVRIDVEGCVPSREGSWHDLLNALCWATFPQAKAALSARQHTALRAWVPEGARRLPGVRSRERDALAMLDEGAVALLVHHSAFEALGAALTECDDEAVAKLGVRAVLFGHALYEHLVCGDGAVRGLPVCVPVDAMPEALDARVACVDAAIATALGDATRFSAPPVERAIVLTEALVR